MLFSSYPRGNVVFILKELQFLLISSCGWELVTYEQYESTRINPANLPLKSPN